MRVAPTHVFSDREVDLAVVIIYKRSAMACPNLGIVPILVEIAQALIVTLVREIGEEISYRGTKKEPAMSKLVSRNKRVKHTVEIGTVQARAGALVSDLDVRIEERDMVG